MTRKILGIGYYPIEGIDSFQFVESIHFDDDGEWKLILTKDQDKAQVFGDEVMFVYSGINSDTYRCQSDTPENILPLGNKILMVLDKV